MRELKTPETCVINGKEVVVAAGSWIVESAFEADTFSRASKHAPGAMTARKFTHYAVEEHNYRKIEVRMNHTADEVEFFNREFGELRVGQQGVRVLNAHGPLVLKPEEAQMVEAGLEACAEPLVLGEPIPERAVPQQLARLVLDILAEQRTPGTVAPVAPPSMPAVA